MRSDSGWFVCLLLTLFSGLWTGCAPVDPDAAPPEGAETETPSTPAVKSGEESPRSRLPSGPQTPPPSVGSPGPAPTSHPAVKRPAFDPAKPDWKLRYQELFELYSGQFQPPPVGEKIEVELSNGNRREGILRRLDEVELELDLGNGLVTFVSDGLSDASRARFFREAFAHLKAMEQGRSEYQMWQRRQQTVRATPVPTPVIAAVEEIPPNGSNSYGKPPVNEPPNGRVWQVDAYIRKNAAVPHSLRYKAWGPVQPHPKGYQVRVQYSLESAEDFGTSHEDMMFFMTPTGRVYQRAPVK